MRGRARCEIHRHHFIAWTTFAIRFLLSGYRATGQCIGVLVVVLVQGVRRWASTCGIQRR